MRYFIVFYTCQIEVGVITFGSCGVIKEGYPNREIFQNSMKDEHKTSVVIITNIIELNNETDFNNFIK